MDRRLSNHAQLSDALALVGAPACTCDGAGIVTAVNEELTALLGADLTGTPLGAAFAGQGQTAARDQFSAALLADCAWDDVLKLGALEIAVQVRSKPLASSVGGDGASFVFTDIR